MILPLIHRGWPCRDAVYDFLQRFFLEVAELFPEPVINFCGDELRFECLESNQKIMAWAKARNMSGFDLEQRKFAIPTACAW